MYDDMLLFGNDMFLFGHDMLTAVDEFSVLSYTQLSSGERTRILRFDALHINLREESFLVSQASGAHTTLGQENKPDVPSDVRARVLWRPNRL